MEPPPFGAGNGPSCRPTGSPSSAFNGATAFRRWNLWVPVLAWVVSSVLQWSHRLSALETPVKMPLLVMVSGLQWSHRLSALETLSRFLNPNHPSPPSMEPPPFGAGNARLTITTTFSVPALQWSHRLSALETWTRTTGRPPAGTTFNGATAFRRWKHVTSFSVAENNKHLQWSHRLSALVTFPTFDARAGVAVLQWSHRLSALETWGKAASMGLLV